MHQRPIDDAAARRRALEITCSFIVQAPAGSGKTELLIQRFLALLSHVDAPEEIVAITFTRKAAGEMRSRVLAALASSAADSPPAVDHEHTTWELARAVRARDAEARWDLAANPNRLRIDTIDALCHALARQMPVLSRFGAQPETVEDAAFLYEEAALRTLAVLDDRGEDSARVTRILVHLDNDIAAAIRLIADMLARRDQWIRHVAGRIPPAERRAQLEAALAHETQAALARLAELMPDAVGTEVVALATYAAGNLAALGKDSPVRACANLVALPGTAVEDLDAWRGIAGLLLTQAGAVRRQVDVRAGFPPGKTKAEKEASAAAKARFDAAARAIAPHRTLIEELNFTRLLPPARYTDAQWEVVEALTGLLPLAVARLDVLFGERGQADFTGVSQAALRALGEPEAPTDLALALDYRIRHILVDEFQDTSLSQYELLIRLTAGWESGDGRTLFVVGDPMQSIYRFREAEVGLYLRARHEGIGAVALKPLTLSTNFRSQQGMVDWVNGTFKTVLPDAEDLASGAVPYAPSVAQQPPEAGAAVTVHTLLSLDRDAEAQRVVDLVTAARAAVIDETVAILVRSRGHLAAIAPRLKEAGLKFQAIEIEALGHRPVVQDLLALTRALLHPADRIAWLALLRAPWCGLTLADLNALASGDHRAAVWSLMNDTAALARLSGDGRRRLDRVKRVLAASLARRRRAPLSRWIEGAWLALGGPACAEDAADMEDALVYFRLLDELEGGGELADFETLAERVEALFALPDTEADARLQVMTIHKAKGLEFDTVIVPGLGYPPRRKEPRLLMWSERPRTSHPHPNPLPSREREMDDRPSREREMDDRASRQRGSKENLPLPPWERVGVRGSSDLLLAPIREAAETEDTIYRYLDALDDMKGEHEDARLLYVAATRAKSRLHLIGQINYDGRNVKPRSRSLLERLWPVVEPDFNAAAETHSLSIRESAGERVDSPAASAVEVQTTQTTFESLPLRERGGVGVGPETDQPFIRRLPADWSLPAAPAALAWTPRAETLVERLSPHDQVEFSWASETAKHVGTVVHRFLRLIAEEGLDKWSAARAAMLHEVYARDLKCLGVPESELKSAIARVAVALAGSIADERGRWVLGPHAEAQSELRLTGVVSGAIVSVAMDRTFVDDQGSRWIVDYKTGVHEGADVEAFLDNERIRYREQLEQYAVLMKAGDSRPIRLGLYFPLLSGWREWAG